MSNHPDSQLGIAMLTARLTGDREAYDKITEGISAPYAIALLMRTAEMMVNMIAELTGTSKEEALKSMAAALAAEM